MKGIALVDLQGGDAAWADRLLAHLERGEFKKRVAIRAGELLAGREWVREGNA